MPTSAGWCRCRKPPSNRARGAKVAFDITADAKPGDVNKGLERVARLLNLCGSAGQKASDVKVAVVFHDEAIKTALADAA